MIDLGVYNGGMTGEVRTRIQRRRLVVGLPVTAVLLLAVLLLAFGGRTSGLGAGGGPWISPQSEADKSDDEAAAAAQDFLRLVAESRRDEDSAPLPCTWVTGTGGLLNPCMRALAERWPELEPIERVGAKLSVRSITSRTETSAVVTDADISPRPDRAISVTLERVGTGVYGWRVRQLNQRDLPQ